MTILVMAIVFGAGSMTVCAGDINGNEQRIISFYNQVFYYGGKSYVATESAKGAVYSKLVQDDVDLTADQVEAAIQQARSSVKQGIEQGYLVEVSQEPTEPDPEDPIPEENQPEENQPEENQPEEEGTDGEEPEDETPDGPTIIEDEDVEIIIPDVVEEDPKEPVKEEEKPVEEDLPDESGDRETQEDGKPDSEEETEDHKTSEEKEEGDIISDVVDEIREEKPDLTFTAESYPQGLVEVYRGDKILLKNTLPVKNTGYDLIHFKYVICGLLLLFAAVILTAIGHCIFANKHGRKE